MRIPEMSMQIFVSLYFKGWHFMILLKMLLNRKLQSLFITTSKNIKRRVKLIKFFYMFIFKAFVK